MQHSSDNTHLAAPKVPWNKGKMIGAKPPLQTKRVWSIRPKLQMDSKNRDLAMFNLAIDSKLRGCDVVHIKMEDVAPRGLTADRACVRRRKTGLKGRTATSGLACRESASPLAADSAASGGSVPK